MKQQNTPSIANKGMPEMETKGRALSRFEFWPAWFFYTPVLFQSLYHGIKYGDVRLPLIANPSIKLSGMVGESKAEILSLAGDYAKQWIPHFVTLEKTAQSISQQLQNAKQSMEDNQLSYPIVAKPDKGCRGVGVKLLHDDAELTNYIKQFPLGAVFLLQRKSDYTAEAGLFYIRYPDAPKGFIFSITLKYSPVVVGDGEKTLKALIETDPRASQLSHLFFPRHKDKLNDVLEKGAEFQLAFAGNHSAGCIFKNGNQFITDKLAARLDQIFADYPGYYFGRVDVKFKDIDTLMTGDEFDILEMNGSSSEAGHIWDSNTPLKEIFSTLLYQYKCLYEIGYQQKKAGHKVPKLKTLFKAWQEERQLARQYPETD